MSCKGPCPLGLPRILPVAQVGIPIPAGSEGGAPQPHPSRRQGARRAPCLGSPAARNDASRDCKGGRITNIVVHILHITIISNT